MNKPFDQAVLGAAAPNATVPPGDGGEALAALVIFLPSLAIGGAEIALVRLAGAFAVAGHRVAIVTQIEASSTAIAVPPAVEHVVLGVAHTRAAPFALARFVVTWRADTIITGLPHNNIAAILAGLIAQTGYGWSVRVVATEHAPIGPLIAQNPRFRYRVLPFVQRLIYPFADAVVCASRGIAAELAAALPPRTPIHTIFNPIVAATPALAALPHRAAGQPALIVAAGRLAPEKDFATLLRAFAQLRGRCTARLVIAGEGPEREALAALAAQLGIADAIDLPGFSHDLPGLLNAADVFVSTSRFEGFSNVIVEALACGTKIVATDCPVGPREILAGGRFGTLVPVGDASAIAAALLDALETDHDRAASIARAGDFTVDASVAAYRSLIGAGRRRSGPCRSLAIYMHDFSSGGVEHAILSLATAFRVAGIDVTLLVHSESGDLRCKLPPGIGLVNFATSRTSADLWPLRRYLRTAMPDILLANLDHNNLIAILASMLTRSDTRLIIAQHNALSAEARAMPGLKYRLLPLAYRFLAPRADGIVAVSEGVADDLAGCAGLDRAGITVINNPVVDPVRMAAAPSQTCDHAWISEAASVPIFVTAGRLVAQKDHETLIRAFAIAAKRRSMRLVILGEGPLRPKLAALIATCGIGDAVLMSGYVANPLPWFAAAAAFVLASRYEGFGNVLVEAMACGTPVISTDCPHGPSEILDHGKYGRLVPPGDIEALASALDPDLRRFWPPETLRARAAHYTIEASVDRYRSLFDRLCDQRAVV